jgi:hypothetical protein
MTLFTGGCLCGDVRYEIDAEPMFAGFCHCRDCQRAGGGGHSTVAAFPEGVVTITKGQTVKFNSFGGSGAAVTREFCGRCGSSLFSGGEPGTGRLMVALGSLDDSSVLSPAFHIFGKDRPAWDHVAEGHVVFDHLPPAPPPG